MYQTFSYIYKVIKNQLKACLVFSLVSLIAGSSYSQQNAVSFDGNGDFKSIPDSVDWDFGTGDFTIEFWLTLADPNRVHDGLFARDDFQWIAMEYNHDGNHKLSLWIDNDGTQSWDLDLQGAGSKTDWIANTWYHIAIARSGTTITVYVDGQVDITASYSLGVHNPTGTPLYFGRSQVSDRFHEGLLDEVRIWNVGRTQAQIQAALNIELSGSETGLVGYWKFNEASGQTTAADSTGNDNGGTLNDNAVFVPSEALIVSNPVDEFSFKRGISLLPSTSAANQVVKIELNPQNFDYSKTFTGGKDIRFFDINGSPLSYWMQNWNPGGTSVIWVKVPLSGTAGFELKYGNPLAVSESDQSQVFLLFDSFPSFPGWSDDRTTSCGSFGMMGGYNTFAIGTTTEKTVTDLTEGDYVVSFDFYHIDSWDGESGRFFWNGQQMWSRAHISGGFNICGHNSFGDSNGVLAPTVFVGVTHSGGDAVLKFNSTLDQGGTDESWGVNNIRISPGSLTGMASGNIQSVIGPETAATAPPSPFVPVLATGLPYTIIISEVTIDNGLPPQDTLISVLDATTSVGITALSRDGQSLRIDGSGDYFQVANHASLNPANQITVEAWVKTTDGGGSKTIVAHTNGCASSGYLIWLHPNSRPGGGVPGFLVGSGPWLDADIAIHDNQWHHVAGTFDGSTARIYVDGVLRNSGSRSANLSSSNPLQIGGSSFCGNELNGYIDDVRIWNITRTQAEIQNAMNITVNEAETGLAGYWKFDGDGADSSNNGNDGSFVGNSHANGEPSPVVTNSSDIIAWENDLSNGLSGFTTGNSMAFVVRTTWFSELREFNATPNYVQGDGTFGFDPFTVAELNVTTGLVPDIVVSENLLNFNAIQENTTADLIFTVSNPGNAILQIPEITSNSGVFTILPTSLTLNPNDIKPVTVTFSPTGNANYEGVLTINSDDPDELESSILLRGIGLLTPTPTISVFPQQLNFENTAINTTRTQVIDIINLGNADLSITDISSSHAAFTISGATSFTLPQNQNLSVSVNFVPTTAGDMSGTVTIAGNDGNLLIPVSGFAFDNHFTLPVETGLPYTVVIDDVDVNGFGLNVGDEVAVYDGSILVGLGVARPSGMAVNFNNSNDYIQVPSVPLPASYTIEAWGLFPLPVTTGGWRTLIQNGSSHHHILVQVDGQLGVFNGGFFSSAFDVDTLTPGWHFISAASTGNQTAFYIDGILVGVSNTREPNAINYLGNWVGTGQNFGVADEYRIWDFAKTAVQIRNDMNQILFGTEAGLIGYWNFDLGNANDLTANNRHGTLINTPEFINDGPIPGKLNINVWEEVDVNGDGTVDLNGFTAGNPMSFKIWTNIFDTDVELDAAPTYTRGDGTFGFGDFTVASLTADSQLEPDIEVSTAKLFLGQIEINDTSQGTIIISNLGNAPLQVSLSENSSAFSIDTNSTSVIPASPITVTVTFSPTTTGSFTGLLTITSDDPDEPEVEISLEGFAIPAGIPAMSLSINTLIFPPTIVGNNSILAFNVINTGTAPLSITNTTSTNALFSVNQTAFDLNSTNDNQEILITFQPNVRDVINGVVTVTSNAGNQSIKLEGIGYDGHFQPIDPTGFPYQIVIENTNLGGLLAAGDEIGVFDGVQSVGTAIVTNKPTSLALDGNGDRIDVADNNTLDGMANLTLEAWVFLNNTSNQGIIRKQIAYALSYFNGTIQYASGTQWTFFNTGAAPPIGEWFHIATVWNGSVARVYINGNQIGSDLNFTDGAIPDNTNPIRIGFDDNGWYLDGNIDELRIWNVARTESEIVNTMNREILGTSAGLVGYWRFNGDISDESGNGNEGVLIGDASPTGEQAFPTSSIFQATVWEAVSGLPGFTDGNPISFKIWSTINGFPVEWNSVPTFTIGDGTFGHGAFSVVDLDISTPDIDVTSDSFFVALAEPNSTQRTLDIQNNGNEDLLLDISVTPKKFGGGQSLSFDGSGDYIATDAIAGSFNTDNDVTISMWIKPTKDNYSGGPGGRVIWSTHTSGFTNRHIFFIRPNSGILSEINNGDISTSDLSNGQWHHWAVTMSGTTIKSYVNGILEVEKTVTRFSDNGTFSFGQEYDGSSPTDFYLGLVDELRVWNTELIQTQVQENMSKTLSGSEAGLVAYWNFDDGTATDISGNGNSGSLFGNSTPNSSNAPLLGWLDLSVNSLTISPAASQTVDVNLDSAGLNDGIYEADIEIVNNTPNNSPVVIPVSLNVTGDAQISVSTNTLDFGQIIVGQTNTLTISVSNIGTANLTINSFSFPGSVGFDLVSNVTFPLIVTPLANQEFAIEFSPAAGGVVNDTLTINSDAINDMSFDISLTGEGLTPPDISVSPLSWAGTLQAGTIDTQDITISNSGQASLNFTIAGIIPWVSLTSSSGSVSIGADIVIQATISAIGLFAGSETRVLTIQSDDPDEPGIDFTFNLTVEGDPEITVPQSVDFGTVNVGSVETETVGLINSGADVLTITSITLSNSVFGYNGNQTFTIDPGTTTDIDIRFTPDADNIFNGILTIASDAANGNAVQVVLAGTGLFPPDISLAPTAFTEVLNGGQVINKSLTIENLGGEELGFQIELGKPGKTALGLDGTGDYVSIAHTDSLNPVNEITIEAWIFLDDNTNEFISAKESTSEGPFRFWVDGDGDYVFRLNSDQEVTSSTKAVLQTWAHVAATFDGSIMRIYINGALDNEETFTPFTIDTNTANLRVGRSFAGQFFNGLMDEFRLWNRAKNLSQIQAEMNQSLRGNESGLIVYFRFDEIGGNLVNDLTSFGHNGAFFGSPQRLPSDIQINDFLSVTPLTGSVSGGTALNVSLEFDTTTFKSNLYVQTLTISSNDPVDSQILVPVSMTVVGQGQIAASVSSLAFSDTFVGVTNSLPVTITNNGSEPLSIFAWNFSNADFSVSDPITEVPEFSNKTVNIFFSPTSGGPISGTLTISNNSANDTDFELSLSGTGIIPPVINVSPSDFSVNLDKDSATSDDLTIANTGGSDLSYSIISEAGGGAGQSVRFTGGEGGILNPIDYNQPSITIEAWVNPQHSETDNGTTVFARLDQAGSIIYTLRIWSGTADDLAQSGYEIITQSDTSGPIPFNFVADQWVHLTVAISPSIAQFYINGSPVFTALISAFDYSNSGDFIVGNDNAGNNFHGDIDELRIWDTALAQSNINTRKNRILVGDEAHLAGYFHFDNGMPGNATIGDITANQNDMTLSGNAAVIDSTAPVTDATGTGVSWLTLTGNTSGIIQSGNAAEIIALGFNTTELGFGSVFNRLFVTSNDVDNGFVIVPISFTVNAPEMTLSAQLLDFGNVNIGENNTRILTIFNTGNRTLNITSYFVSLPAFSFPNGVTPLAINDGGSDTIIVQFDPGADVLSEGILTVESNAGPQTIQLRGIGIIPVPEINVTPATLTVNINEGTTTSETYRIENSGQAELNVSSITSDLAWVTLSPQSVDIAAGQFADITVDIDATAQIPGTYNAIVTINNNDADENPTTIPVTINVGPDPSLHLPITADNINMTINTTQTFDFAVENQGDGTLGMEFSANISWIEGLLASLLTVPGQNNTSVNFTINTNGLGGGAHQGIINIVSNDGNHTYTVNLTVLAPVIDVSTQSISKVTLEGRTSSSPITISNTGLGLLQVIVTGLDSISWLSVDQASVSVGASQSIVLSFTFNSTGLTVGTNETQNFAISHNDPTASDISIAATIEIVAGAEIVSVVLDSAIGYQPGETITATQEFSTQSLTQTVVIDSNIINQAQTLFASVSDNRVISDTGTNIFNATVVVPNSLTSGTYVLQTILKDSVTTQVQDTSDVQFIVGTPVILLDDTSLDFGSVPVNGSATQSITVTNDGDLDLTFNITGINAPFSITPENGAVSLDPDFISLQVTFQPTATGNFADTFQIVSNAGTVNVSLTGLASTGAIAAVPSLIIETLNFNDSLSKQITITNTGQGELLYNLAGVTASNAGGALRLDGDTDHVTVPHNASLTPASITVEAWIYATSYSTRSGIVLKSSDDAWSDGYGLAYLSATDDVSFFVNNATDHKAGGAVAVDEWHHVAGVYDGVNISFYLDGELSERVPYDQVITHSAGSVLIGNGVGTDTEWHGFIDEVRIWNIARTPEQIRGLMNIVLNGDEGGLVGYWQFTNDAGSSLISGQNNGSLIADASVVISTAPISQEWVSLSKLTGTLGPGADDQVTIHFRTDDNPVSYFAELLINSNDPQNPQIKIPVSVDTENLGQVCN